MHVLAVIITAAAAAPGQGVTPGNFAQSIYTNYGGPLLTALQYLIPAAVGAKFLEELHEHRGAWMQLAVKMIGIGGAVILGIQLLKGWSGVS